MTYVCVGTRLDHATLLSSSGLALKQVDVIELEPLKALLHRLEYMLRMSHINRCCEVESQDVDLTLRLRPCWLTRPTSSAFTPIRMRLMSYFGATAPKSYDSAIGVKLNYFERAAWPTFVMITSSSRGSLSSLIAFPSITSDSPFE